MQYQPDRYREKDNDLHVFPAPVEVTGLDGENRDHEIGAESGVAEERHAFRISASQSTPQRHRSQTKNPEGHGSIHRRGTIVVQMKYFAGLVTEGLPGPVCSGPRQGQAGLDRSAVGYFGAG